MTAEPPDPLFEAIEFGILGQDRTLTRLDVERLSGESLARIDALWKALGFTTSGDDARIYTETDVEAVRTFAGLVEVGFVDPGAELSLARSMGRSFARLAEWEVGVIAELLASDEAEADPALVKELIARVLPSVEEIQDYVWRRHLAAAAGRLLLRPPDSETGTTLAVGFADIVGFTRKSRELTAEQLAALVEAFEQTVTSVITDHHGRVIKTIGDEVLFVADDPADAGRIALDLARGHTEDDDFPEVRVGAAYGDVLSRLGDVFGEVVNIAARLTSIARPGRVLVDRGLAEALGDRPDFRVRRARTAAVKGYSRLECFALKEPRPEPDERSAETPLEVLETLAERITERRSLRANRDQPADD